MYPQTAPLFIEWIFYLVALLWGALLIATLIMFLVIIGSARLGRMYMKCEIDPQLSETSFWKSIQKQKPA